MSRGRSLTNIRHFIWRQEIQANASLRIGPLSKFGLLFPVMHVTFVFDQALQEMSYPCQTGLWPVSNVAFLVALNLVETRRIVAILYSAQHGNQHRVIHQSIDREVPSFENFNFCRLSNEYTVIRKSCCKQNSSSRLLSERFVQNFTYSKHLPEILLCRLCRTVLV